MKTLLTTLFLGLLSLASSSFAASGHAQLDSIEIDATNTASLQRGARTFTNYCLSCHEASYMLYSRLGKDLGLTNEEIEQNLLFTADKVGAETMTNAMRSADAKRWFGATPPDLSVIARARGTDWLYTYMRTFYKDTTRVIGSNNVTFDKVGMPHILWQQQGYLSLEHGEHENHLVQATKGTLDKAGYDSMSYDLVNFLAYLAEPSKLQRLALGKWVLLYLFLLFLVAYPLKKAFWQDIK